MDISNKTKPNPVKKRKNPTPESQFRFAVDTCSKTGDLTGALELYAAAVKDSTRLSPYHFNTLLHIVSASVDSLNGAVKQNAVDAGFRIFDHMVASGAVPTEATVTSIARIAASGGGGGVESAFELVKTMKERYGASPRLRTYGPALFGFCRAAEPDRAYDVEDHMAAMEVALEEPEIAALLEVSVKTGKAEKVYEYMHKLRRTVGCVAALTADVLEQWFMSELAGEVGVANWDLGKAKEAVLINGGGWQGFGWFGEGRWEVRRAKVSSEGCCSGCGQQLACVDIDVGETEKFAESVAGLAMEREVKSNFKNFQEWLSNHADYDAIVDGANVGFYQQNFAEGGLSLSQLDTVVKELFERSQSKWPLIILHNRRARGLMENPSYKELIETWIANDALYITPSGSNDDWYWMYAAVKLKSLLVTNDEMRDHIFELLGRNYFLKWKERHQVRYTFVKGNVKLLVPPPYSSVIQESEVGSWHVPIDDKCIDERLRGWLCVTRSGACASSDDVGIADLSAQTLGACAQTLGTCASSDDVGIAESRLADLSTQTSGACASSGDVGIADHSTQTSENLVVNESANCVRQSSSNASQEKLYPANGKRKDREPSLSEELAD